MGLAESIANAIQKPGGKCTVGELRATLNSTDQAALDAAMKARVSVNAIMEGLRAEGHVVTRSPIERHRRGECACGAR